MSDLLDINDSGEITGEEEGDHTISRLKDKVTKRKGRGFGGERSTENVRGFESVDGSGEGDAFSPQKSVEGWILFVTSVHEEASEEDVSEKFAEYGVIKNINLNLDRRTGFLKGYALVEYGHYEEAEKARIALNGSVILGQTINVDWCFVKGPKKTSKRKSRKH